MAESRKRKGVAKPARARGNASAKAGAPKASEWVGAAQAADLAKLERLLARGADPNASWRNYRALHALIQETPHGAERGAERGPEPERGPERLRCLEWLLAHGADPDALGAWPSARAILVAAFAGRGEFLAPLEAAGARRDLHVEASQGRLAAVKRALERDPGLADARDEGGLTPLTCCAGSRLFRDDARGAQALREVARVLLDAGADPNARVRSWGHDVDVAYFAIHAGHLELLELLLERGARSNEALVTAAWQADRRFAEATLRHGARPDEALAEGRPILNELVRWGQVEGALWLLAHGASPNRPDARGWTALHQAVSRGSERLVRALLEAGGDPRRADGEGVTPYEMAAARGKTRLTALFR